MAARTGATVDPAADEKRLLEIFEAIDEDHSKTLERAEIEHLAERMGNPLSPAAVDEAMSEMDPKGSGHVDFKSFSSWYIKKHSEAGEHRGVITLVENETSINPIRKLPSVYLTMACEFGSLATLVPVLGQIVVVDWGGAAEQVGLILSVQYGMAIFGGIILGNASDRIGVKNTLILIMLADIILFGATGFAKNATQLMVIRGGAGFFSPMSVANAWLIQVHEGGGVILHGHFRFP